MQSASKGDLRFAPGALPPLSDFSGAELHTFPGGEYYNTIVPVTGYDAARGVLSFDPRHDPGLRAGNRFFIENVPDHLDVPGEWFLDAGRGQLRVAPDGPGFPQTPVVAPRLTRLLTLQGDSRAGRFVEDLRFTGLHFEDADHTLTDDPYVPADAAIGMSGARHCTIRGCRFSLLAGYALRLDGDSQAIQFLGNDLSDLGEGGVILVGDDTDQPHDNVIAGNEMRRLGRFYKHVAGVYVTTGSGNRIACNTIADVLRYGISLKSYGLGSSSHRNTVEFNDLRRTNQETHDSGAIETLGRDRLDSGNVIRFNRILDMGGLGTSADGHIHAPDFTWGVYLDDFSSGTTVYGNVIARTVLGGFDIHGGRHNRIENNVFADGSLHATFYQSIDGAFMAGNVVRHNLIVSTRPGADLIQSTGDTGRGHFARWDDNLYWLTAGPLDVTAPASTPLGTFADWRAAGFDAHSIIAAPQFVDAPRDDYRLHPSSPAWGLRFRRLPLERIGAAYWRRQNIR